MKEILLTQGQVALVDDANYETVNAFKWHAQQPRPGIWYAARSIRRPDGKQTKQYLHHFLMPGLKRIDHRSGDGLDNQRQNLRPATNKQNAQGFRRKGIHATSRFRGVTKNTRHEGWQARIRVEGKLLQLGCFGSELDAARAYDAAARKYFGDFAHLNLTPQGAAER